MSSRRPPAIAASVALDHRASIGASTIADLADLYMSNGLDGYAGMLALLSPRLLRGRHTLAPLELRDA
jgi:hypothetical protein